MPPKLTVVLGAGASSSVNFDPGPLDNAAFRPPLTPQIFQASPQFREILRRYPLAEILASEIDMQIRRNRPGVGLEQILGTYQESLSAGQNDDTMRQFLQIPLYLNDLFGEVSSRFTQQPHEYNNLVNLARRNSEILFLSLNYDTLLELPLSRIDEIDFSLEEHYTRGRGWMLVKLHGSCNWYRKFRNVVKADLNDDVYLRFLRGAALPPDFEEGFSILKIGSHRTRFVAERTPIYPALTVPVEGKYELNCPASHLAAAKEFLGDCSNYLIIGTSGKDQDLLEFLGQHAKGGRVLVVGRDENHTAEAARNFERGVPQWQGHARTYYHERCFTGFVDGGDLEKFLQGL